MIARDCPVRRFEFPAKPQRLIELSRGQNG